MSVIAHDALEKWLNAWVDAHDGGPDFTDDDTLAVFAFIAELRVELDRLSSQHAGAVEALERLADPSAWNLYERPHRHTTAFAQATLNRLRGQEP